MAALRARIRRMEGGNRGAGAEAVPFGVAAIDCRLPGGGLARGALHEVIAVHAGAATGFCAALLARLMADHAPALWCTQPRLMEAGDLHGPGLARFGLAPERLMVVRAGRDREVLWVMEEALRCRRGGGHFLVFMSASPHAIASHAYIGVSGDSFHACAKVNDFEGPPMLGKVGHQPFDGYILGKDNIQFGPGAILEMRPHAVFPGFC